MTIETSFIVIHILDPNLRLSQRYNGGRAPFQFMQRMKPRRERGEYHDERRHEYKFEYMYICGNSTGFSFTSKIYTGHFQKPHVRGKSIIIQFSILHLCTGNHSV